MHLEHDVPLAPRTSLGVGGLAEHFVTVESEESVAAAVDWARSHSAEVHVLGGGTNIVASDRGVRGLVVHVRLAGYHEETRADQMELTAFAGEPWDEVVERTVLDGWSGLECLSGVPGLVGATPIQNVGAYGQEVSDTIVRVRVFDTVTLEATELPADACGFAYRNSRLKTGEPGRFIVLSVTFRLKRERPTVAYPDLAKHLSDSGISEPSLVDVRNAVLAVRRAKSMVLDPADPNSRSCGSFFTNPIVDAAVLEEVQRRVAPADVPRFPQDGGGFKLSAAWLIEQSGLRRGHRQGAVGLSTRHALAVVCHDDATAADVWQFSRTIRATVKERLAVDLELEPVLWGDFDPPG